MKQKDPGSDREIAATIMAAALSAMGKTRDHDIAGAVSRYRACRPKIVAELNKPDSAAGSFAKMTPAQEAQNRKRRKDIA
jgi:hypothetical protein